MSDRPLILTFVACYLPGYKHGGPIRTIANMVEHLGNELDFRIVAADRDALDTKPYPDVSVDAWNEVGNAQVYYCSPGNRSIHSFARLMRKTPHDILYLNSFFNPIFTLRPLLARYLGIAPRQPCVIAPRGEFSAGALSIKAWKKRPYMATAGVLGLYRGLIWQASSEYEAEDIRRVLGSQARNIVIAPNMPSVMQDANLGASSDQKCGQNSNCLRIVFLSWILPKKNLDFALRVLMHVKKSVIFDIYGPIGDEGYWRRCCQLIDNLPVHVNVQYHGPVPPTQVPVIMASHDLFFLPTKGENYGHVIPEALAAGTPVLIADTTPWRDLEQAGVGWNLPLNNEEKFARCIEECAGMDAASYTRWRERIRTYARERLTDAKVVEANRKLFLSNIPRLSSG